MKTFKHSAVGAFVLIATLVNPSQVAAGEVHECKFRSVGTRNWISDWLYLYVDGSSAFVFDKSTRFVKKGAVAARPLKKKNSGQPYRWTLKTNTRVGQSRLSTFILTLAVDEGKRSNIAMTLNNSRSQREFARGECKQINSTTQRAFLDWAQKESSRK